MGTSTLRKMIRQTSLTNFDYHYRGDVDSCYSRYTARTRTISIGGPLQRLGLHAQGVEPTQGKGMLWLSEQPSRPIMRYIAPEDGKHDHLDHLSCRRRASLYSAIQGAWHGLASGFRLYMSEFSPEPVQTRRLPYWCVSLVLPEVNDWALLSGTY